QLKQNKQQSKKNNMTNSQEDQMEFGDTSLELDSVQPENLKNENLILSKCYKMRKKAQDQMCLLINNNWWFSWAYKKTKNVVNNVIIDLAIV
ncbi:8615_t:CDS:1, partial [Rhizophagus irregularis]